MVKIREAILVEGRYDKNTLSQIVDAPILETAGFGIFKDKKQLALLRQVAEKRGLIVFTDSDGAGFVIRNHIKSAIPNKYLKHAYIPARMEKLSNQPAVYLDGGHNKEGIDALLSSMDALNIQDPIIIFGMLKDKPYQYAIQKLALRSNTFIGIEPPIPRAIPAYEIRDIAEPYCEQVYHCEQFEEAAALAKEHSRGKKPIIACGSLYAAGEMAQALKKIFNNS